MDIMEILQGMSEEERTQFLSQLGVDLGGEQEALTQQMAQAQALRGTPGPRGRRAGGTFVAANPLEFLGAGLKQYQGGQQVQDIQGQQADVRQRGGDIRSQIMAMLAKQGTQPAGPVPGAMPASGMMPMPQPGSAEYDALQQKYGKF